MLKRVIPIPDILVDALKEAKANCTSEFVFCNTTNGPLSYIQYKHLWHAVVCRTTQERTYYKYVDGKKIRCYENLLRPVLTDGGTIGDAK